MRLIEKENQKADEKEFEQWCNHLLAVPQDFEPEIKQGLTADLELQPARWLNLGVTLIQSGKVTGYIQLSDGVQGPPMGSFLPYPVFQIAAEIYLKGMWLCQFDELRSLKWDSYIDATTREDYEYRLGGKKLARHASVDDRPLGHDLLSIVNVLRRVPRYRNDGSTTRFLQLMESLIRTHYFPFYRADKSRSRWANARYPKRSYDDAKRIGRADAYKSYAKQRWIARLFEDQKKHLYDLWNLPGS